MASIHFYDNDQSITDAEQVQQLLHSLGVWNDHWETLNRVGPRASHEEILLAFEPEIGMLKKKFGFVSADVVDLTPETSNLDDVMIDLGKEHTHDDDEVRFTIEGNGVFFVHLENGQVAGIQVESGDVINVPAGTKHWFRLCEDRRIRCIRMFKHSEGWKARFVEDGVQGKYADDCTVGKG